MPNFISTTYSTTTLPPLETSVDKIAALSITELNDFISSRFSHRWIRDMAWALLTPNFFSQWPDNDGIGLFNQESLTPIWQDSRLISWLYDLDKNPAPLAAHMKTQRATRLGIYFEQLLSFYFSHYPRFRLLAKNLQANGSQRTMGEYDFIVWDNDDRQHYHIEVAVKFYVGFPAYMDETQENDIANIPNNTPIYNWHQWIGPNKRDSLSIKVDHLLKHQLLLSNTPEGAAALETIGLTSDQIKPKLLLTGRLYLSYKEVDQHVSSKGTLHANLPQHGHYQTPFTQYWFDQQWLVNNPQWLHIDTTADVVYIILPRQLWMSNLTPADIDDNDLDMLSPKTFFKRLGDTTDKQLPLHVVQLVNNDRETSTNDIEKKNKQAVLKEAQRFFIL
ncbi:DUF1853 family protein [Eionea flava]